MFSIGDYAVTSFCYKCGKPFPWTKTKIEAAKELTDELENLNDNEKKQLKSIFPDLIFDKPKTNVSASKLKKFLTKAKGVALSELRKLIVDIASESVKKLIKDQ